MIKKRLSVKAGFVVFVIWSAAAIARAAGAETRFPRLGLKITGGFGFLSGGGGDIETLRTDTEAVFRSLAGMTGFKTSFDWKGFAASPEMGAELILNLSPHLGLSVGSGYIFGSKTRGTYSYSYGIAQFLQGSGYSQTDHADYAQEFSFKAVPIRANLYVSSSFEKLGVYAFAGPELVFATIDHLSSVTAALQDKGLSTYSPHTERDVDSTLTARETVTSRALGCRAGLGLEVRVAGPVSLGLEVFGRILRLKGWTGDGTVEGQTRLREWMEGTGWYNDKTTAESLSPAGKWLYAFDYDPSLRNLHTLEKLTVEGGDDLEFLVGRSAGQPDPQDIGRPHQGPVDRQPLGQLPVQVHGDEYIIGRGDFGKSRIAGAL